MRIQTFHSMYGNCIEGVVYLTLDHASKVPVTNIIIMVLPIFSNIIMPQVLQQCHDTMAQDVSSTLASNTTN